MKIYATFVVYCCLCLLCPAISKAGAARYTIGQAVSAGLEANPGVAAANEMVSQARLNVKAARGYFLPSFTLQSSVSRYFQSGDVVSVDNVDRKMLSNQLAVSQTLFSGFAIVNNYAKAKIQTDAEKARLDQARLELIYSIQQDFLQLLKSREDLDTVNNELERIRSQLDASRVFYKAGFSPLGDVLKNEVELSRAETDKIKVLNSIKNYSTQLNTYLAIPFDEKIDYVGDLHKYNPVVPYDLNSAIVTALSKRPDLLLAQKSVEIAKKEAKGLSAKYYPRVTLDYAKILQRDDYKNYFYSESKQEIDTIGVNLQWNLFDGGNTTYSYKGELRHIKALEKQLDNQISGAKAIILKAFTDIEDAKKLIDVALQARKNALENYNFAAARYKIKIGTINDLLDAQYSLTRSESDIGNAYMQYHIAKAALFYNIGVENFGLN